ncbi:MAG TPA: isochorismatase family cysteine hydrolase [Planctomicrobium sp.]|nr:isochorismatase family cysteine hydrolase [Planctomicrobium sp.]
MLPKTNPESSHSALLLIDVINDLDFSRGKQLLEHAIPMADRIWELQQQARQSRIPVIYVNDNFGRWRSDFQAQIEHCEQPGSLGKELVRRLRPDETDYFVLKPKHSGFYSTTLELLLRHLGCRRLILTGIATNICVLFTANDAYMRDYQLIIPRDCSAANSSSDHDYAINQMESVLKADVTPSTEVNLKGFHISER